MFQLIRQHSLFSAIHNKIIALIELDTKQALKLFLDDMKNLPSDLVVERLSNNEKQLFLYLDALCTKDGRECFKNYLRKLVQLYADFGPKKLLRFLKSSDQYLIQVDFF